jgi:glutathione S-transferase
MLKLWGRANSSNVQKAIWLLEELGLPYDRVDVGGPFGGTSTPEYRAMNPLGMVPSMQDGDLALFESNVIMRYICNAYAPTTPLYPTDPTARAHVEMWMDFQQTAQSPPQSIVFQGLVRVAPEKRNHEAIAAAAKVLNGVWAIIDARLARHTHIVGNSFTLADIVYGMHAHRWLKMDVPGRLDVPHLAGWYDRMLQRPAFAKHVATAIT